MVYGFRGCWIQSIVAYFPPTPSWNNYIPQLWIYLCPLQIQFQYKILLPLVVSIRFQRASVNYANLIRFYLFIYQWSRTKLWDWFCWLAGCCVVIVHWENQYWESPSITLWLTQPMLNIVDILAWDFILVRLWWTCDRPRQLACVLWHWRRGWGLL